MRKNISKIWLIWRRYAKRSFKRKIRWCCSLKINCSKAERILKRYSRQSEILHVWKYSKRIDIWWGRNRLILRRDCRKCEMNKASTIKSTIWQMSLIIQNQELTATRSKEVEEMRIMRPIKLISTIWRQIFPAQMKLWSFSKVL